MIKKVFYWFERHYILSLILAILIALLIFYLSSKPPSYYPQNLGFKTKIYHMAIYFLLTSFLLLSIIRGKIEHKYFILIVILIALLYGTTDEIHQSFIPGRSPEIKDVLIDSVGILSSSILYTLRLNFNNK